MLIFTFTYWLYFIRSVTNQSVYYFKFFYNHEEVLKGLIHVFSSNIWFISPSDNLSSHTDLTKKFIGLQKCTQPAATCLTFKLCCSLSSMWCFQSTSFQQFSQYKTKSLPDLKEGFNTSCALFASFSRDTVFVPQIRSSEMFHLSRLPLHGHV